MDSRALGKHTPHKNTGTRMRAHHSWKAYRWHARVNPRTRGECPRREAGKTQVTARSPPQPPPPQPGAEDHGSGRAWGATHSPFNGFTHTVGEVLSTLTGHRRWARDAHTTSIQRMAVINTQSKQALHRAHHPFSIIIRCGGGGYRSRRQSARACVRKHGGRGGRTTLTTSRK